MHQIAKELPEYSYSFTPYYGDGILRLIRRLYLAEPTILGFKLGRRAIRYLKEHHLDIDIRGIRGPYDLVVTCSDLVMPKNILNSPIVLVQEGMTDPEDLFFHLVKRFRFLPRWLSSTAATGLSDQYDVFCVASEGYRDLFVAKGARLEKIVVTGIPNYDNARRFLINNFPHRNYVLVCTSDSRETWRYENRKKFIRKAVAIAAGRPLIFKLHPNENVKRATREIDKYAPGSLIFSKGITDEMIANCDILVTRFSTVVYTGLALGKEVFSEFDLQELRRLVPLQNASAARNIAAICREILEGKSRNEQAPVIRRKRITKWVRRKLYQADTRRLEPHETE